jgi:hypothetical protein
MVWSPYFDLSNSLFFREWTDVVVYAENTIPNPTDKNYCTCLCSHYPILKSSIPQHLTTNKHKAMLRLIKTE